MTDAQIASIARIVRQNADYPDMRTTGQMAMTVAQAMHLPPDATIIVTVDACIEIEWTTPDGLLVNLKVWCGRPIPEFEPTPADSSLMRSPDQDGG